MSKKNDCYLNVAVENQVFITNVISSNVSIQQNGFLIITNRLKITLKKKI